MKIADSYIPTMSLRAELALRFKKLTQTINGALLTELLALRWDSLVVGSKQAKVGSQDA